MSEDAEARIAQLERRVQVLEEALVMVSEFRLFRTSPRIFPPDPNGKGLRGPTQLRAFLVEQGLAEPAAE